MCVPRETIKPGRKNANGPGPLRENRVPATSSPSARRRNLIKRLLAARRGLSTFRHLADTGRHSLTSLHAYTVAPRVRETRVLPFTVTRKRGARTYGMRRIHDGLSRSPCLRALIRDFSGKLSTRSALLSIRSGSHAYKRPRASRFELYIFF